MNKLRYLLVLEGSCYPLFVVEELVDGLMVVVASLSAYDSEFVGDETRQLLLQPTIY